MYHCFQSGWFEQWQWTVYTIYLETLHTVNVVKTGCVGVCVVYFAVSVQFPFYGPAQNFKAFLSLGLHDCWLLAVSSKQKQCVLYTAIGEFDIVRGCTITYT